MFWIPDFSKSPDYSNQNKIPLDLTSADATFDFLNSWFFKLISITLGGSKNRDSTVILKASYT